MRAVDEAALFCDFAEYYHIYDWNQFTLKQQAMLACGLPEDSRIIRKISNQKIPLETTLLLVIVDSVRELEYLYTSAHSKKKVKKPDSLLAAIQKDKKNDVMAYETSDDFEAARARIIGGKHG